MLRETNVPIIQESVGKIYELSNDEQIREYVRQVEKARLDWNSGMYNAELRGIEKGEVKKEAEIAARMRALGMSENEIQKIIGRGES